jgi:hypothetical protein
VTPEKRREVEREAIDAILRRIPPGDQEMARRILERPHSGSGGFSASTDPEIARLLGVISSIRSAGRPVAEEGQPEDENARADDPREYIRVLIALVPHLSSPGIRGTVIRRPNDGGQPVLLLRESDLTVDDLYRGLRAAAVSFKRYGLAPAKERRLHIRVPRETVAVLSEPRMSEAYLRLLKAGLPRVIPGIGEVRGLDMMVSPEGPR